MVEAQISLVIVCIKPECLQTKKGRFAEGISLIRQGIPGVLQNMQHTVTVSWSAINGLTDLDGIHEDQGRTYVYGEIVDRRSWFFVLCWQKSGGSNHNLFCSV